MTPTADEIRQRAQSMLDNGCRGPLPWARSIFELVVNAAAPPAPTDTEAVALLRELVEAVDKGSFFVFRRMEAARAFLSAQPPAVDAPALIYTLRPDGFMGVRYVGDPAKRKELENLLDSTGEAPIIPDAPPADIEGGGEVACWIDPEHLAKLQCGDRSTATVGNKQIKDYGSPDIPLYTAPLASEWDGALEAAISEVVRYAGHDTTKLMVQRIRALKRASRPTP